jgi:quercetin dioxygenase-like cupin family protein
VGARVHRAARPLSRALLAAALVACGASSTGPAAPPRSPERPPPEAEGTGADDASAAAVAAVERAVNTQNRAIHACWAMGAADDFRLEGEVLLSLVVGEGGAIEKVEVVRDTTGDAILVDCLKALWAAYRWPPDVFAAEDSIRLPPFRFGAPETQHTVSSAHVPRRPLGASGPAAQSTVQVLLHPENTGNGAGALSLLELAPGMKIPRHRHGSAELLLVLSGEGVSRGRKVAAGDALYIAAGTPHDFETTSSVPLVAVQLYAPAGPERRFLGQTDPGTQPLADREGGKAAPRVASAVRARAYQLIAGKGKAQIVFDAGSAGDDAASLIALTFDGDAEVAPHVHDGSSEYLYLIEGRGVMRIDGQDIPIQPGDAIQIPSGIDHSFRAEAGPVKAVQFYTPAGPEQRFKGPRK